MVTTWTKEIEGTDVTFEVEDVEGGAFVFTYKDPVFFLQHYALKEQLGAARIHSGNLYAVALNTRVLRNATHIYNHKTQVWELIKP